jgi:uncharacterized protein (DUF2267 family)
MEEAMSTTILPMFDKSLQTTAIWLDEIEHDLGPDRAFAWRVLSVVLQQLRDHLPLGLAAHFGAQLPMVIRGTFYDQFDPTELPKETHSEEDFLDAVANGLQSSRGVNPKDAAAAVFGVLHRHLTHALARRCDGGIGAIAVRQPGAPDRRPGHRTTDGSLCRSDRHARMFPAKWGHSLVLGEHQDA